MLGLPVHELFSEVNIYPNLSTAFINIEGPRVLNLIEILDNTGKLVLKSQYSGREIGGVI